MRAYPEDLRQRIVQSAFSGQDIHDVAERYQVSTRTVWRYLRQHREQGDLHPKPRPGRRPKLTPEQQQALREQLQQHPSLTLAERVELFGQEHEVELPVSSMHRWIKKLRYSRKKPPSAPSNETSTSGGRS